MAPGMKSQFFVEIMGQLSGFDGLSDIIGKLGKMEAQAESASEAIEKLQNMQKGFQKQTMPDIMKGSGRSIFAGEEGGEGQAGRGMSPLNNALEEAQQMSLKANEGMTRFTQKTNDAGERVQKFTGDMDRLSQTAGNSVNNLTDLRNRLGGMSNKADSMSQMLQDVKPQIRETFQGAGVSQFTETAGEGVNNLADLRNELGGMSSKGDSMTRMLEESAPQMQQVMNNANNAQAGLEGFAGGLLGAEEGARGAQGEFGKLFGLGMNLMFMGLALQQVFGSMTRKMFKTTGASAALGGAMKSVLLPFFSAITPFIVQLSSALIDLPKPIKFAAGFMVMLATAMGALLFFGSQVFILSLELSFGFATLTSAILGSVLALGSIVAAFTGVVMLLERGKPLLAAVAALAGVVAAAAFFKLSSAGHVASKMFATLADRTNINTDRLKSLAGSAMRSTKSFFKMAGAAAVSTAQLAAQKVSALGSAAAMGALATASMISTAATMALNGALTVMNVLLSPITLTIGAIVLALGALVVTFMRVKKALSNPKFIKKLKDKFKPLTETFNKVKNTIGSFVDKAVTFFKELLNNPVKKITKLKNKVRTIFNKIKSAVIQKVTKLAGKAKSMFTGAVSKITNKAKELRNKAVRRVKQLVGKVVGFFKSLPSKLARRGRKLVSKVTGFFQDIKDKGEDKIQSLIDFVTSLPSKISNGITGLVSTVSTIGEDLVNGIIDGIEGMGSSITNALSGLLPEKLGKVLDQASDMGSDAISSITSVLQPNDFILTSGGKMIEPAANDTIVGFNGQGPIQPGGGGGEVTVNINDPVMNDEVDVQSVVDEVENRVNRDTRGRSGGI